MAYAHSGPAWVEVLGAFAIGDQQFPPNWPQLADADERAAVGLAEIVEPEIVLPEGEVFAGWAAELIDVAGVPTRVATFAAAPRRLIAKSLVQERVDAVGKLDEALAALLSQPLQFARWFAPDWPQVYADDAGLLFLLAAVGCTEEQVAAITA